MIRRFRSAMPYGLTRYQQAESLHFLTFSCNERKPYLTDPTANAIVEETLERTRARHDACIYAYVLMPEHVHILMNEPPKILVAMFLKAFKQEVSQKLKGDRDHFWQHRYFDRNIRGEDSMSEIIRYIHRNPVPRGLVSRPEDYSWSSYRQYAVGVPGVVQIESEWLAVVRSRAAAKTTHRMKQRRDEWGTCFCPMNQRVTSVLSIPLAT